jgi:flavin reductase (DIM6/NTAB) family NADH-FMN oxidoreductase RutF
MQVSKNPPMVAVSLHQGSASAKAITISRVFAVNILSLDSRELAERFITPIDRFDAPPQPKVTRGVLRLPLLNEAIGHLECEVRHELELGDHHLFIGEIISGDLSKDDMPLTTISAGMGYGGVTR